MGSPQPCRKSRLGGNTPGPAATAPAVSLIDTSETHRATERAVRHSYGKLVAILASRGGDIASAEDALANAFRIALQTWPLQGIPTSPEAWLVTVARRELGQDRRHKSVIACARASLEVLAARSDNWKPDDMAATIIPDERLKLMFVCAHPAIDASVQAPLMLQSVLGLDAMRIAACFLTAPAAMSQRLVRAKQKIREAGIGFVLPDQDQLPVRIDAVLTAIYAAYGTGWEDFDATDPKRKGLAEEAIWLARVAVQLLPSSAEARGLLSLMLHCEARRPARRDANGRFVALSSQDTELWSAAMIAEAETTLRAAARLAAPGRFQIEAAIQSVHVQQRMTGLEQWPALLALYDYLARLAPTLGVQVARAAAVAEAGQPSQALELLAAVEQQCQTYQPFWAAKGQALKAANQRDEAKHCFTMAAGLTEDMAVRAHLLLLAGA
jgi:RNA polymerase sigma-70 factor, ECF subfamily